MIVVIRAGSVVCVALHQHELFVDLQNRMDSLLHLADRGRARGDKERLALARHALQRFDPVNLARACFINRHIRVKKINRGEIIRRREIVDAHFLTFFHERHRPREGNGCGAVHLSHRFFPRRLMADLRVHVREAIIRNDLRRVEILELGSIRPRLLRQADKQFRPLQIAVVVRGDVGDEVGGMVQTNRSISKVDFHVVLKIFSCYSKHVTLSVSEGSLLP